ncbi:MAG TPA: bifunctional adenosylcobinamide kinase/adenosylcobinamide-phosphate guanylyltransferase [Noviherbaspirillum sp.]|uniref:bifunctional adenosylcobinamide kinase/adenosylcobinamide-phosphate guanylyltransferase n=1 Tax=Noviherbaspirillum sp. TaxID=1926288 RepID=UPI002D5F560C|nr:bifunctional adenosylcobinamide kinase/adenosylcobinamide-phosphate guanylyltransferase [Noviherbaspirillum sp.]HYD95198.1 bifunctional adenosylcobinamide kinase/adenosylcobinamide-phosphate guanylyltransferase [Noviherbaspirillum sp.]
MTRTFVFGGARSGKSAHAEALAAASGREVVYLATAQAGDAEMANRIAHHRERRDGSWTTVEEPLALGAALAQWTAPGRVVLVDCLTVWLSNLLFCERREYPEIGRIEPPARVARERAQFLSALEQARGDVILVSNEVGMGIVPQGAVSRWFVDEAGRLNQAVAARCERAVWVAAGLPLVLKEQAC